MKQHHYYGLHHMDCISENSKPSKVLKLSPQLFEDLDEIARQQGFALDISTFEDMSQAWGRYSNLCGSAYTDARKPFGPGSTANLPYVTLAAEINLELLRSTKRPELDWAAIPDDKIFRFILWHELGHGLHNFCELDLLTLGGKSNKVANIESKLAYEALQNIHPSIRMKLHRANEVLADRFAWEKLFPNKTMPVIEETVDYFERRQADIDEIAQFIKLKQSMPAPLPCEPWAMIPRHFIESDTHFYLLGDPNNPSSRAGILMAAWKQDRFYIGNTNKEGGLERISAFYPDLETAIQYRSRKRKLYPHGQIFYIPPQADRFEYGAHELVEVAASRKM